MSDNSVRTLPVSYWKQWTASAISNLGDGINFVAMPLLALTLTDDERLLSLTVFITFVPWLLLALPVGAAVDRLDRQRLMVAANLVRVAAFITIGAAALGDRLNIWNLIAILLVVGSCEVLFDSTAQAFLPQLVEAEQLARANGFLYAAEVVAGSLAGLAIGAVLFEASVGLPFHTNAATFAVAALLIATIRPLTSQRTQAGPSIDHRLRSGFAWLLEHRLLRTLAAMFAITNLALMLGQGIFVKYAVDELELSPFEFGMLLAITAMGAATGGLIGHRVISTLGLRWSTVLPYAIFGSAQFVLAFSSSIALIASAGFIMGGAVTIWNVATVTIRQREIPADRFGRVNGVYRWLGAAASAIGVAAGGFIAHANDLRAPFVVAGVVALAIGIVFAKPVLSALGSVNAPASSAGIASE